jgi:hypothetical protein
MITQRREKIPKICLKVNKKSLRRTNLMFTYSKFHYTALLRRLFPFEPPLSALLFAFFPFPAPHENHLNLFKFLNKNIYIYLFLLNSEARDSTPTERKLLPPFSEAGASAVKTFEAHLGVGRLAKRRAHTRQPSEEIAFLFTICERVE